jgi:hypothetical protein
MDINTLKFLEGVKKIHLINPGEIEAYDAIPDTDVRKKLSEIIEIDKELKSYKKVILCNTIAHKQTFNKVLDNICSNIVGNTLFKLLLIKMKKPIYLVNYDEDGSGFSRDDYAVKINLSLYETNGNGKSSRQYYYVKDGGSLGTKLKSLSRSIFHEFCHGLHHASGTMASSNTICVNGSNMKDVWEADEELRTITCFSRDPICDHMFDLCQSRQKEEPFLPRYSHKNWPSTKEAELLKCIPESQKFMDGWREYMIS